MSRQRWQLEGVRMIGHYAFGDVLFKFDRCDFNILALFAWQFPKGVMDLAQYHL